MPDRSKERFRMVERQIAGRGVRAPAVLAAMTKVPREQFMPDIWRDKAYADRPLPIGCEQTISQPYIVAFMIEALQLKGGEKVLEIGTGSGYAAAVLAQIAGEVYSIERIGELASRATEVLKQLGLSNIHVKTGDGTLGWPEHAPYDAIVVTAGGPELPLSLKAQLKAGGRLVMPAGKEHTAQTLMRVTRRTDGSFESEDIGDVRFVPLLGEEGWRDTGGERAED